MTSRRLTLTAGLLAGALAVAGPAAAEPVVSDDGYPKHSSDGIQGPVAPSISPFARTTTRRTAVRGFSVAPGVAYSSWTETSARGPIRAHLVRVFLGQPGLRLDYASPRRIARTQGLRGMLRPRAVAAINGDFFDIGDTGAPFGIGAERAKDMLHGPSPAWSAGFIVGRGGRPFIGPIQVRTKIRQRPQWTLTNINSPSIPDGGIGLYNKRWGPPPGYGVTDGQRSRVVQVRVKGGKVVNKRFRLRPAKRIDGFLLIGRGKGARQLRSLRVGDRIGINRGITNRPRVAITSNSFLVRDGQVTVSDDREMHPRSAIGISHDTNELLMLVVDGRQAASRGYTMVELANMMLRLGAEDALNLDGGGSSTLVARGPNGNRRVTNTPSDGRPRKVANGIQIISPR